MFNKATAFYNQLKDENGKIQLSPFIPVISSLTGVKSSTLLNVSNLISDIMGGQDL